MALAAPRFVSDIVPPSFSIVRFTLTQQSPCSLLCSTIIYQKPKPSTTNRPLSDFSDTEQRYGFSATCFFFASSRFDGIFVTEYPIPKSRAFTGTTPLEYAAFKSGCARALKMLIGDE